VIDALEDSTKDQIIVCVSELMGYIFGLMDDEGLLYADPGPGNIGIGISEGGGIASRLTDSGLVHKLEPEQVSGLKQALGGLIVNNGAKSTWAGIFDSLGMGNSGLGNTELWGRMDRAGLLGDGFADKTLVDKFKSFPRQVYAMLRSGVVFDESFVLLARNVSLSLATVNMLAEYLDHATRPPDRRVSADDMLSGALMEIIRRFAR
jgi:hypothetical protein